MIASPLADQYKMEINIRPVKTAYFVKEDDEESLIRVLRLVCTQWGGIRNLIIPVEGERILAPIFVNLLELNKPNRFVTYLDKTTTEDKKLQSKLNDRLTRLFPTINVTLLNGETYQTTDDHTAHILGIIDEQVLKNHTLTRPTLSVSKPLNSISLALYGDIYPGQQTQYEEKITLDERQIELGSEQFWRDQTKLDSFASVLNLTAYKIKLFSAVNAFQSNRFDIFVVNNINSLCMYWNWRAQREAAQIDQGLGRRTLLLPEVLLDQKAAFDNMFVQIRKALPYPNIVSNLHMNFLAWDHPIYERLKEILADFDFLEYFKEDKISVRTTWGNLPPDSRACYAL